VFAKTDMTVVQDYRWEGVMHDGGDGDGDDDEVDGDLHSFVCCAPQSRH